MLVVVEPVPVTTAQALLAESTATATAPRSSELLLLADELKIILLVFADAVAAAVELGLTVNRVRLLFTMSVVQMFPVLTSNAMPRAPPDPGCTSMKLLKLETGVV